MPLFLRRSTFAFVFLLLSHSLSGSAFQARLASAEPGTAQSQAAAAFASAVSSVVALIASPARTYRVAIQVGHWKNSDLPEQLSRLVESVGTSGGGHTDLDLNLDVANRVAVLLRASGVTVDMLPATVPTGYSADAFVAIHADGSDSAGPRGFKISTRWRSEVAVQDAALVDLLAGQYVAATGLPEDSNVTRNMRGYYAYSPWRPNYRVSNFTPSAIVETGYMTNAADRAVLFNNTQAVASGVASGVLMFLKAAYTSPANAHGYGYGVIDSDINANAPAPPSATPTPGPKVVQGDWQAYLMGKALVNVYSEPGSGSLIGQLPKGRFYHSTLRSGDYYRVTLPNGKTGWVHRNAVIIQM